MQQCHQLGVVAACVLLALGCGRTPEGPPTYPARGTLHINGTPAEGAQVTLHPADGQDFDTRGARPTGHVDATGRFELTTYEPADGAPEGDYVMTVYWAHNPASMEPSPDRLKGRFGDPRRSKLEVRIEPEENEIPLMELSTDS